MILAFLAAVISYQMPPVPRAINGQIIETNAIWNIEFVKQDRPIKFIFYPSYQALNAEYHRQHPKDSSKVYAFSDPWSSETCTVNIVDPRVDYQAAIIGHEMMHCMFGTWHNPMIGAPPLTKKTDGN